MKRLLIIASVVIAALTATFIVSAQDGETCPVLVQEVIQTVSDLCNGAGRNQACYGNLQLSAEFQPEVESISFENPGDLVDVINLLALRLSSLNTESNEWGVALMRLQANLPNTLPGQNATMLLFGDVDVEPSYIPSELTLRIIASGPANVRRAPAEDASVLTTIPRDAIATATGRDEAGDWLRVSLDNGGWGWVSTLVVQFEGDVDSLNIVDPADPIFGPLQAFALKTGIGDSGCEEAPESGIMIQSPEGQSVISFNINEVNIELGSTAFFQAQPDDMLYIYMFEGRATVRAFNVLQTVPAGYVVAVPLDSNGLAAGPPNLPQAFDPLNYGNLPVSLLERDIDMQALADTVAAQTAAQQQEGGGNNASLPLDTFLFFEIETCTFRSVPPGENSVTVNFRFPGPERFQVTADGFLPSTVTAAAITVDGVDIGALPFGVDTSAVGNRTLLTGSWQATPGEHTVVGAWTPGYSNSCTFTIP